MPLKLLLLLPLLALGADWQTCRYLITTEVTLQGVSTTTRSSAVLAKKAGDTWSRITLLEPEAQRSVCILKNRMRTTWFPDLDRLITLPDTSSDNPDTSHQTITRQINRNGHPADSLAVLDKSGLLQCSVILEYVDIPLQNSTCRLLLRTTCRTAASDMTVTSTYGGYRLNEPVPDNTFELSHDR